MASTTQAGQRTDYGCKLQLNEDAEREAENRSGKSWLRTLLGCPESDNRVVGVDYKIEFAKSLDEGRKGILPARFRRAFCRRVRAGQFRVGNLVCLGTAVFSLRALYRSSPDSHRAAVSRNTPSMNPRSLGPEGGTATRLEKRAQRLQVITSR